MKYFLTITILLFTLSCSQRSSRPQVTAEDCNDSTVLKKIQDSLSPKVVLQITDEEYADYKSGTSLQGLHSYELDTSFNDHCLLSITASGEWDAAYVQGFSRYLCFDRRTGNKLSIADLLREDSMGSLVKLLHETAEATAQSQREDVVSNAETIADTASYDEYVRSSLANISVKSLEEFYVKKDGITFIHHFSFGHAFWNISPGDATLTLSPQELQGYIKPGGPLSFWLKE